MPATPPMMTCGHSANATCSRDRTTTFDPPIPSCAICDCITVADALPTLDGRMARCNYRTKRSGQPHTDADLRPSDPSLAFFHHRPDQDTDEFYCGCWGWD